MVPLRHVIACKSLVKTLLVEKLVIADFLVGVGLIDAVASVESRSEISTRIVTFVLVSFVHGLEQLHQIFVNSCDSDALLLQAQTLEPLFDDLVGLRLMILSTSDPSLHYGAHLVTIRACKSLIEHF